MEYQQLLGAQRQQSVSTPLVVNEFDLKRIFRQHLDNCADLSSL